MNRTEQEDRELAEIRHRLDLQLRFLTTRDLPTTELPSREWFQFLAQYKEIVGNASNDLSFVSCLLAKHYLVAHFDLGQFDVAEKPQGANGLDIDVLTSDGRRVIGEIKTTTPYKGTRFGANQIKNMQKDLARLRREPADLKYMFVTDPVAFAELRRAFELELNGVELVCLTAE